MKNKENKEKKEENTKQKKMIKISIIVALVCIIVVSVAYIIYYNYQKNKDENKIQEVQEYFNNDLEENNSSNEKIEKVKELSQTNPDIKAWIQIEDTKINYPVLQSDDNEFYLNHDYKKEKSKYGSIYIKSGVDIDDNNSNIILYGHDMKDGGMFKGLLDYANKEYYQNHQYVSFTTQNEERQYQIIAAFKSRVFYQDEKNVFRYYDYKKFDTEDSYNEYISNVDKIKLYDTGIKASYQEQLLTMITCEYSQENGRMVVVAKRIK